ncbi:G-TYPE LECTIN S-RECEPTOR-LIKE SERINE/THREONINE-PROTEIN KINASE SD2-5 [Salix viminalis]|uniref:G-TYPE LECTIN S-RECEPTOR-LIKE SERINE/THREONINE-PROTEIN KINASE SD2-5 n=1 Tax=Salix viminalis TaxID=40686 RepID=A0A9Q0U872_SALVM|nr:G-TYPE LECTIN S-RECEPTOR-LIKE SERINE/THREONINE-PROTEIN KINASE SD2-5 [Salix viminalis]
MSACDALKLSIYCCYGPDICKPSLYSNFYKNLCPQSYSYALDRDINTTYSCPSTDYQIIFCPGKSINTTSYRPNPIRNTTGGTANNSQPPTGEITPSSMPEIRPNATSRRKWGPIIAGVVGGVLAIISFVVIVVLRVRWSKSEDTEEDEEDDHIQQVPGMPVRNVDHSQPESAFHLLRMLQEKAEYILGYLDEYIRSDGEEIIRMLEVAAWCLQDDPERRPLMSTVVKVLEGLMEHRPQLLFFLILDDVVKFLLFCQEKKWSKLVIYLKGSSISTNCGIYGATQSEKCILYDNCRGGAPAATLAEFGLGISDGLDFYDVSLVYGFNLPLLVVPSDQNCSSTGCIGDVNESCPTELEVTTGKSINTTSYGPNSRNTTGGTANNSRPPTGEITPSSMPNPIRNTTGVTANNSRPPTGEITPSSMPEIRPNATSRRKWGPIIAGVVGGVLAIISFVVIVVLRVRWSKSEDTEEDEEDDHIQQVPGMPVREMSEVQLSMRGTPGYLAPEWHKVLGQVTIKVDVYSFGIVLLEVVCARRNIDHSQPESAFHLLRMLQEKAEYILGYLDEYIRSDGEEIIRMLEVAAWCLQDDPERRPLMSTVVKVLEGLMEVDSNLVYKFSHALTPPSSVDAHISSAPPPASVLSNPR